MHTLLRMTDENEKSQNDFSPYSNEEHRLQYGILTMEKVWEAAQKSKIPAEVAGRTIQAILQGGGYRKGGGGSAKATGEFDTIEAFLQEVKEKEGEGTEKTIWQIATHLKGVGFEKMKSNQIEFRHRGENDYKNKKILIDASNESIIDKLIK